MLRRVLSALVLASALLTTVPVSLARACDRSGWVYDPMDLTACVDVTYVTAGSFEFANNCPDTLTLTASDCAHCSVTTTIAPGESGMLTLNPAPTRQADGIVDLAWATGDASGTLTFTFPVNVCPEGSSCTAVPGARLGWSWTLLAALTLLTVARRRVPSVRRPRPLPCGRSTHA